MDNTVGRQFFISQTQKDIINGCLLGDGSLECRSKEGSARLRIHHGWKQKDFVFWKYRVLKNLVSCPPKKIICWRNPKNNENYYSWYFHTRTLLEFKTLYKVFYFNKKKILPQDILDLLNPLTLSVWIMDDGCNDRRDSLILNTQNYSIEEHYKLQKVFQRKFEAFSTINKDRDEFRLRFNCENAKKLFKIIYPNIISSMKYKIVPVETESARTR